MRKTTDRHCAGRNRCIGVANAQTFPSRPVTILVPLAPGGSTDTIGRIMAEGMRPHLGQPVIVENSPGAGGSTGVIRVARSAPDGYTVQIGQWGTNVASGAVYNLPIDLLTDLEPVGLIATQPFMIVGTKDFAGGQSQGTDRLDQSQSRARCRSATPASAVRATSRACSSRTPSADRFTFVPYRSAGPAVAGSAGRQHRHDDGHRGDLGRTRPQRDCSRRMR